MQFIGVADRQRHHQAHRRAGPGRALQGDVTTHQRGESLADHQSETGTAIAGLGLGVGLRELREQVRTAALAEIPMPVSVTATSTVCASGEDSSTRDDDFDPADLGEFDGIGDEV